MARFRGTPNIQETLLAMSEIYALAAKLSLEAVRRGERLTPAQALERALIRRRGGEDEICLFRQALREGLFEVDVVRVFQAQNRQDEPHLAAERKAERQGWRVLR